MNRSVFIIFLVAFVPMVSAGAAEVLKIKVEEIVSFGRPSGELSIRVKRELERRLRSSEQYELVTDGSWDIRLELLGFTTIRVNGRGEESVGEHILAVKADQALTFGATPRQRREILRELNATNIPIEHFYVNGPNLLSLPSTYLSYGTAGSHELETQPKKLVDLTLNSLKGIHESIGFFRALYSDRGFGE